MGNYNNDWKERLGIVYSTNPNYQFQDITEQKQEPLPPERQKLRVTVEKHGHGGKTVTVIRGFKGPEESIKELARSLKTFCGTGGSMKDGEILIQGDNKEKIVMQLRSSGYTDTK